MDSVCGRDARRPVRNGWSAPPHGLLHQRGHVEDQRHFAAAQEQLDFLREQLTESQRLATIGTITAVIAHEFNNLLTPIASYSQIALRSAQSDEPDMELIQKALATPVNSASKAGKI